jgi:hypothetical protein
MAQWKLYAPPALASKTLHSAHTVHLCVPSSSHSKHRLFPQTALTGWALLERRDVFSVRLGLNLINEEEHC